jgi:hypothetical protein
MPFNQLKNVKWSDFERLDLDDLNAVSALKDADVRELLLAFMEPGAAGLVYKGFTGTPGVGLVFNFDPVDSLALASDGSLLATTAAAPLSTALPGNASIYLHAYLSEQESDVDNRRFLNDIPAPPEEYTVNTATRVTKVVGLYVTSNTDAVLQAASFQTSAFIAGKTRQLVTLYGMKTSGSGVIAGSVIDFRRMWMVNGNQVPAANGGLDELPHTFPSTNGDRNVYGLRSMFLALTSVLRSLAGDPSSRNWWDTSLVRTDPMNGSIKSSLRDRIVSSRGEFCTVHPTADRGDFTTLGAALASITAGEIRMKAGTHLIAVNTDLSGKSNITISGEGRDNTILKINDGTGSSNPGFVFGANCKSITLRDLSIVNVSDGSAPAGPLFNFTAASTEDITFINCRIAPSLNAHIRGVAGSARNLKFVNCRIELTGDGFFDVSVAPGWNPANDTIFESCDITPTDALDDAMVAGVQLGGVIRTIWNNCRFGDRSQTFTWRGWCSGLMFQDAGGALSWQARFTNCEFWGLESFCQLGSQTQRFVAEFIFVGCRFRAAAVTSGSALFDHQGSSLSWHQASRVVWYDCEVNHPQVFYSGFAANQWPSIFGFNTRFVCGVALSSAARALFYNQSGHCLGTTMRFVNCQFFHGVAPAFYVDLDMANISGVVNGWFLQGCEFYTSRVPGSQLMALSFPHIRVRSAGSGTAAGLEVVVRDCLFQNGHPTQLPLQLDNMTTSGLANASLSYTWQNSSIGVANDSGVTLSGTWRSQDTPFRMLPGATTMRFPI